MVDSFSINKGIITEPTGLLDAACIILMVLQAEYGWLVVNTYIFFVVGWFSVTEPIPIVE